MKKSVLIPLERYERWKALADAAAKTKESAGESPQPIEVEKMQEVIEREVSARERIDENVILACIREKDRRRAELLLRVMDWNEKGEVMLAGIVQKDSHIVDVISAALRNDDDDSDDGDDSCSHSKLKWMRM